MESRNTFAEGVRTIITSADSMLKLSGAVLVLTAILTTVLPPLGSYLKAASSWRFGTKGLLKYEVGQPVSEVSAVKPTSAGNLYLLRGGGRKFDDLKFGDILQSKGPNRFRENNGCGMKKDTDCVTTSPEIFKLHVGECVVVLNVQNADSGDDDADFVSKDGGWVYVATTPCGLFD